MAEQVRWVTKAEAARDLDMSLSTLDRQIRRGEIEVRRGGRRVYVRMEGPEYVSDDELLSRALVREDNLRRTVWELDGRASELERERDEARESVRQPTGVWGDGGGVPERARGPREDEGKAQHGPGVRLRAVAAADRQRSPVVVRVEVGGCSATRLPAAEHQERRLRGWTARITL